MASGTTFLEISGAKAAQIPIPVAPLAEQKQIVAEIEKQFTRLDAATAALQRVQANLKRYRASVLKAACEGRLVPNTSDTDGYPKSPVLALLTQPLANGRSPQSTREGFKILRLTAICDGIIDMNEWRRGQVTASWIENLSIKQGDILVSRGNGSKALVGLAGLVGDTSTESEPILFPDTMIRIRLNAAICDARFFVMIWNSRIVRDQIESTARTTAGIHKIAPPDIERFKIPLPSLKNQLAIVAVAEKALTTLRHTADALERLSAKSSSMRASILSSAFTGQLVPQDPADEPASALLERIRAGRVESSKKTAARKAAKKRGKR
jgi:type I restriction enzyme S subunit